MQHGWIYYFDQPAKARPVDADTLNALYVVGIDDHDGCYVGVVRRGIDRDTYDLFYASAARGSSVATPSQRHLHHVDQGGLTSWPPSSAFAE
ncbi:hypothetical protein X739_21210 [Mesorhizobium sp. LNHC220B00]|nr:hypothetical protein X739_21210 [Mesorhizobium sp. LNHC220B00]